MVASKKTISQSNIPRSNFNQTGVAKGYGFPAKPSPRATAKGLQGYSAKPNDHNGTTYTRNMKTNFGGANY